MNQIAYSDRREEVNQVIQLLLTERKKCILFRGTTGSGISAFLHRLIFLIQTTPNLVCFLSELSETSRSPVQSIIKNIIVNNGELLQSMQMYTDRMYGEREGNIIKGILEDTPYIGNTLSNIYFRDPKSLPLYTGHYSDITRHVFFTLVKEELSKKRIILLVDNAQYLDNDSIYDLLSILENPNSSILLAASEMTPLLNRLILDIEIQHEIVTFDFPLPSALLVQDVWANHNRYISTETANQLVHHVNGDIRKIIYCAKYGELPDMKYLGFLAHDILSILYILKGNIEFHSLCDMIKETPNFVESDANTLENTLHNLEVSGYIAVIHEMNHKKRYSARIRPDNRDVWDSLLVDTVDTLIYEDVVYKYLSKKSNLDLFELTRLFDLSCEIYPHAKLKWGKQLVLECLKNGYPLNDSWIQAIIGSKTLDNLFLGAICQFIRWNFQGSMQIMSQIWPEISDKRDGAILYALTLNRCRKHTEAQEVLYRLLESSKNSDEKGLLLSVIISNTVHLGREKEAQKIFWDNKENICNSKTYGYFLRNSATLFTGETADLCWNSALAFFREKRDEYGEYTTMANMARNYVKKGQLPFAKEVLAKAYHGLLSYGKERLHIVANNLGVVCALSKDSVNAKRYLYTAQLIAQSIMPRTYIAINQCRFLLIENKPDEALDILLSFMNDINKSNIPRLKYRYHLAVAGIYCILEEHEHALSTLLVAEKYANNSFTKLRKKIREFCTKKRTGMIQNWESFYPPAFLEYWIDNPISLLSDNFLSSETFTQDG